MLGNGRLSSPAVTASSCIVSWLVGWSGHSARRSGVRSDQAGRALYLMKGAWLDGGRRDAQCADTCYARKIARRKMKMLRGAFRRCGVITAIAFSAAMFISDAHFNVAEAQKARAEDLACGKELQERCSGKGVPVQTDAAGWVKTDLLSCLSQEKDKLAKKCAARAANVLKSCNADANQRCKGVVAGQGNILACLTTARRVVSARCNAALDAAYLRQ